MILKAFSIFDSKANAYLQPFFFPSTGEAVRAFITSSMDDKSKFNSHGQDFTMFRLGEFDDSKATFDLLDAPELIGRADVMRNQHLALLEKHSDHLNPEFAAEGT